MALARFLLETRDEIIDALIAIEHGTIGPARFGCSCASPKFRSDVESGIYTGRLTWPACVSNWSHAAPAKTSVDLACPISVFTPRPGVGKSGPSTAALRLETAASSAAVCCH
jgi:hypothetical protein